MTTKTPDTTTSHMTLDATELDERELASVTGGAPLLDIPDGSLEGQQSVQTFVDRFRR
jgi:bacteriocin-like protein